MPGMGDASVDGMVVDGMVIAGMGAAAMGDAIVPACSLVDGWLAE
jgi:hypothetical protein